MKDKSYVFRWKKEFCQIYSRSWNHCAIITYRRFSDLVSNRNQQNSNFWNFSKLSQEDSTNWNNFLKAMENFFTWKLSKKIQQLNLHFQIKADWKRKIKSNYSVKQILDSKKSETLVSDDMWSFDILNRENRRISWVF